MRYDEWEIALGRVFAAVSDAGLVHFELEQPDRPPKRSPDWRRDPGALAEVRRQFAEYWAGERQRFELALDLRGTEFQLRVWRALARIPFGRTASYLDIATAIDNPKAVRAVGAANGKNPVWVIVPCHRVIGKSGSLVGYGGGLLLKEQLLEHERRFGARAAASSSA